jgi:hypothetical protein
MRAWLSRRCGRLSRRSPDEGVFLAEFVRGRVRHACYTTHHVVSPPQLGCQLMRTKLKRPRLRPWGGFGGKSGKFGKFGHKRGQRGQVTAGFLDLDLREGERHIHLRRRHNLLRPARCGAALSGAFCPVAVLPDHGMCAQGNRLPVSEAFLSCFLHSFNGYALVGCAQTCSGPTR